MRQAQQQNQQPMRTSKTMPKLNYTQADIQEQYLANSATVQARQQLDRRPSGSGAQKRAQSELRPDRDWPDRENSNEQQSSKRRRRSRSASRLLASCFNIPTHLASSIQNASASKKASSILSHFRFGAGAARSHPQNQAEEEWRNPRRPLSNSQTVGNFQPLAGERERADDSEEQDALAEADMQAGNSRKHVSFENQRRQLAMQQAASEQQQPRPPGEQPSRCQAEASGRQSASNVIAQEQPANATDRQPLADGQQPFAAQQQQQEQQTREVLPRPFNQQAPGMQMGPSLAHQSIYLVNQRSAASISSSPSGSVRSGGPAMRQFQYPPPPAPTTIYKRLPAVPMRTQATQTEITAYHLMASPSGLSSASSQAGGAGGLASGGQRHASSTLTPTQSIPSNDTPTMSSAAPPPPARQESQRVGCASSAPESDQRSRDLAMGERAPSCASSRPPEVGGEPAQWGEDGPELEEDIGPNLNAASALLDSSSNSSSSVSLVGHDSALADTLHCELKIGSAASSSGALEARISRETSLAAARAQDGQRVISGSGCDIGSAAGSAHERAHQRRQSSNIEPPGAFKDAAGELQQSLQSAAAAAAATTTTTTTTRVADAPTGRHDPAPAANADEPPKLASGENNNNGRARASFGEPATPPSSSSSSSSWRPGDKQAPIGAGQHEAREPPSPPSLSEASSQTDGAMASAHLLDRIGRALERSELHQVEGAQAPIVTGPAGRWQPAAGSDNAHRLASEPRRSSQASARDQHESYSKFYNPGQQQQRKASLDVTERRRCVDGGGSGSGMAIGAGEPSLSAREQAKQRRDDFLTMRPAEAAPAPQQEASEPATPTRAELLMSTMIQDVEEQPGELACVAIEDANLSPTGVDKPAATSQGGPAARTSARSSTSTLSTRHHSYCSGGPDELLTGGQFALATAPSDIYEPIDDTGSLGPPLLEDLRASREMGPAEEGQQRRRHSALSSGQRVHKSIEWSSSSPFDTNEMQQPHHRQQADATRSSAGQPNGPDESERGEWPQRPQNNDNGKSHQAVAGRAIKWSSSASGGRASNLEQTHELPPQVRADDRKMQEAAALGDPDQAGRAAPELVEEACSRSASSSAASSPSDNKSAASRAKIAGHESRDAELKVLGQQRQSQGVEWVEAGAEGKISSPSPPTTVSELDQDEELSTPSFVDHYKQRFEFQVGALADSVASQAIGESLQAAAAGGSSSRPKGLLMSIDDGPSVEVASATSLAHAAPQKHQLSDSHSSSSSSSSSSSASTSSASRASSDSKTSSSSTTTSADQANSYVCQEGRMRRKPAPPTKPAHLRASFGATSSEPAKPLIEQRPGEHAAAVAVTAASLAAAAARHSGGLANQAVEAPEASTMDQSEDGSLTGERSPVDERRSISQKTEAKQADCERLARELADQIISETVQRTATTFGGPSSESAPASATSGPQERRRSSARSVQSIQTVISLDEPTGARPSSALTVVEPAQRQQTASSANLERQLSSASSSSSSMAARRMSPAGSSLSMLASNSLELADQPAEAAPGNELAAEDETGGEQDSLSSAHVKRSSLELSTVSEEASSNISEALRRSRVEPNKSETTSTGGSRPVERQATQESEQAASSTEQDLAHSDYTLSETGAALTAGNNNEQQPEAVRQTTEPPSGATRAAAVARGAPDESTSQTNIRSSTDITSASNVKMAALIRQHSAASSGQLGDSAVTSGRRRSFEAQLIAAARASPVDCPYVHDIHPLPVASPTPSSSGDSGALIQVHTPAGVAPVAGSIHLPKRLSHDDTMEAIEDDVEGEEQELKLLQQEQQELPPPAGFDQTATGSATSGLMSAGQRPLAHGPSPVGDPIREEDELEEEEEMEPQEGERQVCEKDRDGEQESNNEDDDESSISVSHKHGVVVVQEVVKGRKQGGSREIKMKRFKESKSSPGGSNSSSSSPSTQRTSPVSSAHSSPSSGSTKTPSKSSISSAETHTRSESQREPLMLNEEEQAMGSNESTPKCTNKLIDLANGSAEPSDQLAQKANQHQQPLRAMRISTLMPGSTESATHAILEHLSQHASPLDEPSPALEQSTVFPTSRPSPEPPTGPHVTNRDESSLASEFETSSRTGTMKRRRHSSRQSQQSQDQPVCEPKRRTNDLAQTTSDMQQEVKVRQEANVAQESAGEAAVSSPIDKTSSETRRGPPLKQLKSQHRQLQEQVQVQEGSKTNLESFSLDADGSICSSCSCMEPSFDQGTGGQAAPEAKPEVTTQSQEEASGLAQSSSATVTHSQIAQRRQLETGGGKAASSGAWMSQEEGTVFTENYWLSHWLYISEHEEAEIWRRAIDMSRPPAQMTGRESERQGDAASQEVEDIRAAGMPRDMSETASTISEHSFRSRYKSTSRKMIHRRASMEMYKRIMDNNLKKEKRVEISRSNGEFGFRIHGSRPVVVSAIERGTSAETCGLQVGDLIYAINGTNILDMAHSDVVRLAHNADSAALVLDLIPTNDFLRMSRYNRAQNKRHEPTVTGFLMRLSPSTAQPLLFELQEQMSRQPGGASAQQRAAELNKVMRLAWRQRYFVLRSDNCLYWYKSPGDAIEPHGGVNLQGFSATLTNEFSEPNYVIRLVKYGGQPHYLGSNNMCDVQTWVDAINKAATEANQNDPYMKRTLVLARGKPDDIQEPDCFGWLYKFSHKRGGGAHWRAAYFVLKDACLYLFRDQKPDLVNQASAVYYLHGYRKNNQANVLDG